MEKRKVEKIVQGQCVCVRERERQHTKLSLDDGHVRNTLVTVIIAYTIKLLRSDINGGHGGSGLAANLAVNIGHQLCKLPDRHFVVWVTHIEDMTISPLRVLL